MFQKTNTMFFVVITAALLTVFLPSVTMGYENEISSLSEELKKQIQNSNKTRIAVVDFTDLKGNVTELGRFIAEEFSMGLLVAGGNYEVVDRSHLQILLKENKLSASGLVAPEDARKIVKVSGVDALITGNITAFNDNVRLSIKILDASTAKLIGASKGNIPATKAIKDLLEKEIHSFDISDRSNDAPSIKTEFKIRKKVEKEGFVFALQDCRRKQQNVRCDFLITNTSEDQKLTIFANSGDRSSYFLDNAGDAFYPKEMVLGNGNFTDHTTTLFYKDSTIKMVSEFSQVSAQSKAISILSITCILGTIHFNRGGFVVKFQNIPILKG